MKRMKIIVISVAVIAAILALTHVALNANWPEILRSLHGR